jgi:hypothetical protein
MFSGEGVGDLESSGMVGDTGRDEGVRTGEERERCIEIIMCPWIPKQL